MVSRIINWLQKQKPSYIVIGVLIIVIIIMQMCHRSDTKVVYKDKHHYRVDSVITIDTLRDTTRIISKVYIPGHTDTVYVDIPANVDTAKILKDYYTKYYQVDTLKNDTSALIIVKDTISQNRTQSRQWEFVNNRPTQIINKYYTYVENKPFNLHFGGFIGGRPDMFLCGPSIMVTTNKHLTIGISGGLSTDNPVNDKLYFGIFHMYWNIK